MSGPRTKAGRAGRTPTTLNDEIRKLQKIKALLVCIRCAADEDVEFDAGDALAAVVALIDDSLAGVDRLEAST